MEFRLPQIFTPDKDSFPSTPRRIKKWLKQLPLVNMGETARQFYQGLKQLNRLDIPPKQRLEDMELMRDTAHVILEHLGRHFVGRTMPLPPRSRKMAQFNHVLLIELAHGYKHVVHDVAERGEKLDTRRLTLAIERALHYLDQSQTLAAQTYSQLPPGLWHEANQLYQFAEARGLADRELKDTKLALPGRTSISLVYRKMCLFAISRPESLHLGEARKLATYLEHGARLTTLLQAPVLDTEAFTFVVNLRTGDPPQLRHLDQLDAGADNRYLDLRRLKTTLEEIANGHDTETGRNTREQAGIGADLARRLLDAWTNGSKRRFARAAGRETIAAAIGLQQIWQAIQEDADNEEEKELELTLQTIPEEQQVKDWWNEPVVDLSDTLSGQPANVWDMVASGTIINDEYLKEKQQELQETLNPSRPSTWQEWTVVNTSAGGYCLRWESDEPSRALVGELIGLRTQEGRDHEWRIGIIRWMAHNRHGKLEIGIQLLAPKTIALKIERLRNRHLQTEEFPVPALMLPGIRTIQQKPSLLVPGNRFAIGDELEFTLFGKEMRVVLSQRLRQAAGFEQFLYQTPGAKAGTGTPRDSGGEDSGFDTVWSSL